MNERPEIKPIESQKHHYLGDGVYLELDPIHIILRTGDHREAYCDNTIYIEYSALTLLNRLVEDFKENTE